MPPTARWGRAWGFIEDSRVSNLVPADYRNDSALTHPLLMAVDSIARRIALWRKMKAEEPRSPYSVLAPCYT